MPQSVQVLLHGVQDKVAALSALLRYRDAARPTRVAIDKGKHRHQGGFVVWCLPLLGTSRIKCVVHLDHRFQTSFPGVCLPAVHPAPACSVHAFWTLSLKGKVCPAVAFLVFLVRFHRHAFCLRLWVRRVAARSTGSRLGRLPRLAALLRRRPPLEQSLRCLGLLVLFVPNCRYPCSLALLSSTGA